MYLSQTIIPGFGFYARDIHNSLIRQNRLAVGLNMLAELDMQRRLLPDSSRRQHLTQYTGKVI